MVKEKKKVTFAKEIVEYVDTSTSLSMSDSFNSRNFHSENAAENYGKLSYFLKEKVINSKMKKSKSDSDFLQIA